MQPILRHVSLGAHDIERAALFYDAVSKPLGFVRIWSDLRPGEEGQGLGYGFGTPDEVATLAVLLASDESVYVTGAEFHVDGGLLAGSAELPEVSTGERS